MNWKTSLSGLGFFAALSGFLAPLIPQYAPFIPWLVPLQPYLGLAALVLGFTRDYWTKDKDMSGGTRYQYSGPRPTDEPKP